jgi:glycosyltransferase involved in cell wall biosynthesis
MRVLTIATLSSLPQARALERSLRLHEPDWPLDVVLVAREPLVVAAGERERLPRLSSVCDELDLDIEALLALHDSEELSILLLPHLLRRVAERTGEAVVHLPSSAWALGGLEPIRSALAQQSVLLVPRVSADVPDDGLQPSREQLERAGRVEETIIGVDASAEAASFLDWWAGHVEQALGSLDARRAGDRPEDRPWLARFMELAPARFSTAVLEDPGCNLNMWNLHRVVLEGTLQEPLVNGRFALRFLNLPGFDPDRPHQLSAGASRARVSRSPLLHELCESYAAELRTCGWRDPDHHAEVGRRLLPGLVYDESTRAAYASALALGEPLDDLFSDRSTRAFVAWLQGPAPRGGAYGINRYLFHRVARERPDVVRTFPDLDGPDGAEFLNWCWAFGRDELGIPDRFMPARTGAGPTHAPRPGGAGREANPRGEGGEARPRGEGGVPRQSPARARRPPSALKGAGAVGVRLTGYLGHTLGLGAAARGYAQALAAAGVPVRTVSVPLHHLALPVELADQYGRHGFEDLAHEGRHSFEIVAVNAEELPDLVTRLGEGYFEGPRIGIWGWETNTIPPLWRRAFALVDEIWVYSRFMAENIGAVAPVPVISLPPPVPLPAVAPAPLRLGVPEGFLFLFAFDYLSTVQRKNPVGLIEAFRLAFDPGEGPQLLIKTINAPLRPLAEEQVLWAAHGREDIHIVDESLSGDQMHALMAACDCYVSLHRAEGFGLTIAEAMAIGKPVIATGYSGNVDFMKDENSYLVDFAIGRVGPDCEIYPPEGEWADPSVEHAAQLLRQVRGDPQDAARRGARAAQDIARTLSPEAAGAAMRDRLERLASGTGANGAAPAFRAPGARSAEPYPA